EAEPLAALCLSLGLAHSPGRGLDKTARGRKRLLPQAQICCFPSIPPKISGVANVLLAAGWYNLGSTQEDAAMRRRSRTNKAGTARRHPPTLRPSCHTRKRCPVTAPSPEPIRNLPTRNPIG